MDAQELRNLQEAYREVVENKQLDEISQKTATKAYAASKTGEFEGQDSPRDVKRSDNLKRQIKRKFGDAAVKHANRAAHSRTFGRKGWGGMPPKPTKEEFVNEADSLAAMQARREKRLAAQRKREGTTATGRDFGHNYSLTPAQQKARRDAEFKAGTKKEEVDLYDIILSYLLGEGYAETPEAAKAIMVNMSEEWRNSIIECD